MTPLPLPLTLQIEAEKKRVSQLDEQIRAYDAKALQKRKVMGGAFRRRHLCSRYCGHNLALMRAALSYAQVSMPPKTTPRLWRSRSSCWKTSWKLR